MDPGDDEEDSSSRPPDGGGGGDTGGLCCSCDCRCCACSLEWHRRMKRKVDLARPPQTTAMDVGTARVEAENELTALREALWSHQQSIQELYTELEEERSSASTAASEAMSMILRLQREKAESLMEARQFKRLADEKMAHDQQEIMALEELLLKRDQALQILSSQLQALRHRLIPFSSSPSHEQPHTPTTPLSFCATTTDIPPYPALRCTIPAVRLDLNGGADAGSPTDLDKYAFGETPRERLQSVDQRIYRLERTPSSTVTEKGVVVRSDSYSYSSPRRPRHFRGISLDSFGSGSFRRADEFPLAVDRGASEEENGDMIDRVYTIDAVHGTAPAPARDDSFSRNGNGNGNGNGRGRDEEEMKKLSVRLRALEADEESMRRAIISMETDKAQTVLLREIAHHLCKEVLPDGKIVKKSSSSSSSFIATFSIIGAVKVLVSFLRYSPWLGASRFTASCLCKIFVIQWLISFVFWRRKAVRYRHAFGRSINNPGLSLLLENSPRTRQRKYVAGTRG